VRGGGRKFEFQKKGEIEGEKEGEREEKTPEPWLCDKDFLLTVVIC
jgi:hypothetical protein